jgi:hypothetical protein
LTCIFGYERPEQVNFMGALSFFSKKYRKGSQDENKSLLPPPFHPSLSN